MNLKTFIFGLLATFGLPWVVVIAIPHAKMQAVQPIEYDEAADERTGNYFPKTTGQVTNGAQVYAENGCYICHTQLIRPTYAGNDVWRKDWGGLADDDTRGDTRRESTIYDYLHESYAQIGLTRGGPDLSNIGRRVPGYVKGTGDSAEQWLYQHFYNPRGDAAKPWSTCPSQKHFFEKKKAYGQHPADAVYVSADDGSYFVPGTDLKALVSYLAGLKRDDQLPASINPAPPKPKKGAK